MPTINGTPGVDYVVAPLMTQAQIDAQEPGGGNRQRYRLTRAGNITIGKTTVCGPQIGVASQLVWLSPETAAGFGTLVELNT